VIIILFAHLSLSVSVAIDAMQSASNPHAFMGVTEQGLAAIVKTRGNEGTFPSNIFQKSFKCFLLDVHVILRGGSGGPNYAAEHVQKASVAIQNKGRTPSIMIDCSREFTLRKRRNGLLTVLSYRRKLAKELCQSTESPLSNLPTVGRRRQIDHKCYD